MKTEIIQHTDGRKEKLRFQKIKNKLWVHYQGQTYVLETQQKKQVKRSQAEQTLEISAPMPGKITKILKKNSDPVEVNETVVVMEAMKMEYSLKSEVKGIVTEIFCQTGDQVQLGQKLVSFELDKK